MPLSLTPDELRQELASNTPPLVLDVRRFEDRIAGSKGIPGAQWRDPASLEQWLHKVPAEGEVAVYCVRGGAVSQSVQAALEVRGVKARFLEGGLAAWEAQATPGGPSKP
jgi:rhodanese-related sulfurtransferase